jgi:hypothetical protein
MAAFTEATVVPASIVMGSATAAELSLSYHWER